jgi:hypothetical protein
LAEPETNLSVAQESPPAVGAQTADNFSLETIRRTALELTGSFKQMLIGDLREYIRLRNEPELAEEERLRLAELTRKLKIYSLESAIERIVRLEIDLARLDIDETENFNYTVSFDGEPTD